MIRLERAPSVTQNLFCQQLRRRRPHAVQKFVRVRYTINMATPKPVPAKRRSLWGALASLFRGAA